MLYRRMLAAVSLGAALLFTASGQARALTITGVVGGSKYLLTGSSVSTTGAHAVLKISFETTTAGDNLSLCAGTASDFAAGRCAIRLNDSGGPGFRFLTIIDAADLDGKQLFILRNVGLSPAGFSVTIE